MIKLPSLLKDAYKISPVCLSIGLSVHPSMMHFSEDLLNGYVWLYSLAIKYSGNIKGNLNSCDCSSVCHGNLNSISEHNLIKLSILHAYISINKTVIICLSDTYLDWSISSDDGNLELPGYNLVCRDNPANTKRGSVCIYYHNSLPLKLIDIQFLNECINF